MIASRALLGIVVVSAACGHPQTSPPAAPAVPVPTAVALDDGTVCPSGPRATVLACLAAHGFCARDADPLDPALPDLAVVQTHGAIDCTGNYLIAAAGGQWSVIVDIYDQQHHNPQYGDFALKSVRDDRAGDRRVTRIDYTVELVDGSGGADPVEHRALACTWPTAGLPSCANATP